MNTLLLDTSFPIDVLKDRGGHAELMEQMIAAPYALACCAINVAEIFAGMRPTEARQTELLLRQLDYVPISREAAKLAGTLKRDWALERITLTLTDTTIAAVCLTHGITLVTGNRKHLPMPDLSLYPLAAAWRSPERQRADPAGNRSPHSKRPTGATRAKSGEPLPPHSA